MGSLPARRTLDLILAGALLAAFAALLGLGPGESGFIDLRVFHSAGEKALAHRTVYDVPGHFQFKYSPFAALLFGLTIGHFSFGAAATAWYAVSVVGWAAFALCLARAVSGARDPGAWVRDACLFFLFFGVALRDELKLGQVNLVPLSLLLAFFGLYGRSRSWKTLVLLSTFLSVAIQFKLYCALVFPYLLFRRDYRLIALTALNLAVLSVAATGLYHGFDFALAENAAWLGSLTKSSSDLVASHWNVSLLGVTAKTLGPLLGASAAAGVATVVWALGVAAFLILQFRFRNRPPLESLSLVLAGVVLLNPLTWAYWVILLAPMLLQTWYEKDRWTPASVAGALVLWVLLSAQRAAFSYLGGICAAVLLLAAAWLRALTPRSGSGTGTLRGTP